MPAPKTKKKPGPKKGAIKYITRYKTVSGNGLAGVGSTGEMGANWKESLKDAGSGFMYAFLGIIVHILGKNIFSAILGAPTEVSERSTPWEKATYYLPKVLPSVAAFFISNYAFSKEGATYFTVGTMTAASYDFFANTEILSSVFNMSQAPHQQIPATEQAAALTGMGRIGQYDNYFDKYLQGSRFQGIGQQEDDNMLEIMDLLNGLGDPVDDVINNPKLGQSGDPIDDLISSNSGNAGLSGDPISDMLQGIA